MIDFQKLQELYHKRNNKDLLRAHAGLIKKEELITAEEVELLKSYPVYFIEELVERIDPNQKDTYKRRFIVEKVCCKCGKRSVERFNKSEFIYFLRNLPYKCGGCITEEINKRYEENTQLFIKTYLDPNKIWKNTKRSKFYLMMEDIRRVKEEQVAQYIQQIDYKDFLQTPYWAAIRERVLRSVGHKCQLCGDKEGPFHIHHNTYEHHGYEHDYYREDLIVLCERCHLLFHEFGILRG